MARSFQDTGTVTSYVGKSSGVVTAVPLSMACWVNLSSYANFPAQIQLDDGTASNVASLYTDSSGRASVNIIAAGNQSNAVTTSGYLTGNWVHVAAVFTSAVLRAVYLNGGSKATSTTSRSPAAFSRSTIGGDRTIGDGSTGSLALVGIWNIALSDQDIATLANGVHPLKVHPEALVACVDLIGVSPEPDLVSGTGWTIGGTGTSASSTFPLGYYRASRKKPFSAGKAISFAGTATPQIANSGALSVTRGLSGTGTPKASDSGVLSVSRAIVGSAAPKVSATGTLMVAISSIHTLRVSASGSMTNPFDSIILAGTASPKVVASGALSVGKSLAGIQTGLVVASGTLTVVSARSPTGIATLQVIASGTLMVPQTVIVGTTGWYIVFDRANAFLTMNLGAGIDYSYLLQYVVSGPYPTYWAAIQVQVAMGEPPA